MIFDYAKLDTLATQEAAHYQGKQPYPYAVFDDFALVSAATAALESFPRPDSMAFYKYDNPLEKKLAMDQIGKLPQPIASILTELNSVSFLRFLETLTGISGLIPDPYYRGGGIHQSESGGKLDIHIDFNNHPKLNIYRRLNAILYLNKDWQPDYNGYFEIWDGHQKRQAHVLTQKIESIAPLFNRFVIFSTSERSYHGFPDPIQCPPGVTRKSIAVYYYTATGPKDASADPHSTTFIARPDDPNSPELDSLREKRNKNRLSTNIT